MATSAFFFPPLAANDQYLADNLVSLLRETADAASHSWHREARSRVTGDGSCVWKRKNRPLFVSRPMRP